MSPPPALAPAMPMGMVHLARSKLIQEDLFSETCRKDSFCLSCNHAFCSHCCFYHHVHSWGTKMMVKVSLDAATGQPVLPTHTNEGYSIMRCMVEEMAAEDFTSRLPRDAFCLYCGKSFSAAVCSHHDDHRAEGLPDAVIRVEERGGRRCVRCAGTEWWTSHLDVVLDSSATRCTSARTTRAGTTSCSRCCGLTPGRACAAASPSSGISAHTAPASVTKRGSGKPTSAVAAGRPGTLL
ncbi:unnamed protein product [Urochloa humidicola]